MMQDPTKNGKTDTQAPPVIFDDAALALARSRARLRQSRTGLSFLTQRALEDCASRLSDINRQFENALMIGHMDLRAELLARLPADKQPLALDFATQATGLLGDYDLIISPLELQSVNDVGGFLKSARDLLRPDGLLLLASFGGASLTELRQSLYAADQALLGGACARVYPMMDYSQGAQMLAAMGLALPVVDMDRFTVSYSNLNQLISDLRDAGLSNVLSARSKRVLPKAYKAELAKIYTEAFAREDGKLLASFEILWLTGWAPHSSQQKPLKPGSAKMRLAEALGTQEKKL